MNVLAVLALGLIAGATIFLGLPLARLKNPPRGLQGFLNAIATGILIFLLSDVLSSAIAPIDQALPTVHGSHGAPGNFAADLIALLVGLAVGLLGLVAFERRFLRGQPATAPSGIKLGYMIAAGIGLHNLSEGLAMGQAAAANEIQLATLLIIGFGLHNMTEGFGIAAPVGGGASWRFIGLAGIIGGGPTFLGTAIGIGFHADVVFILFLALAAGSIIYVLSQLLPLIRRAALHELAMAGLVVGFSVAFGTDLVLRAAGA